MSNQQSNLSEEILEQVESIREQIKDETDVTIENPNNETLRAYGLALENNTQVSELNLVTSGSDWNVDNSAYHGNDTSMFLKFVKTSSTLHTVVLDLKVGGVLARMFLQAATANPNIDRFQFYDDPTLAEMIQLVLLGSKSVRDLQLRCGAVGEDDAAVLTSAFHHNQSVEIVSLLGCHFQKTPFRILAEAIKNSNSVKEISLNYCNFSASSTKDLLDLVCSEHSNIQRLTIDLYSASATFEDEDIAQFFSKVIRSRAPTANLTQLAINFKTWITLTLNIGKLLQSFQQYNDYSKPLLKTLKLICPDDKHMDQLLSSLPSVRSLEMLGLVFEKSTRHMNGIENAIRKNGSLKSIKIFLLDEENEENEEEMIENETLKNLMMRNEAILRWRYESHQIPTKYMAQVLSTCLEYAI